jgi:hypothetical protein
MTCVFFPFASCLHFISPPWCLSATQVQADPPTAGRVHYTLISGALCWLMDVQSSSGTDGDPVAKWHWCYHPFSARHILARTKYRSSCQVTKQDSLRKCWEHAQILQLFGGSTCEPCALWNKGFSPSGVDTLVYTCSQVFFILPPASPRTQQGWWRDWHLRLSKTWRSISYIQETSIKMIHLVPGAPESPKIGWVSLRANGKDRGVLPHRPRWMTGIAWKSCSLKQSWSSDDSIHLILILL